MFRRKNETIKAMVESEEDNFEKSTSEIQTLSYKIQQIEILNQSLRTPGLGSFSFIFMTHRAMTHGL